MPGRQGKGRTERGGEEEEEEEDERKRGGDVTGSSDIRPRRGHCL